MSAYTAHFLSFPGSKAFYAFSRDALMLTLCPPLTAGKLFLYPALSESFLLTLVFTRMTEGKTPATGGCQCSVYGLLCRPARFVRYLCPPACPLTSCQVTRLWAPRSQAQLCLCFFAAGAGPCPALPQHQHSRLVRVARKLAQLNTDRRYSRHRAHTWSCPALPQPQPGTTRGAPVTAAANRFGDSQGGFRRGPVQIGRAHV